MIKFITAFLLITISGAIVKTIGFMIYIDKLNDSFWHLTACCMGQGER